ncbi:MAG: hypothetical protein HY885_18560 [Deltaproteobacteria bacterium]|nr:hypothetical protein [Deltaproteobacteria bacterium]
MSRHYAGALIFCLGFILSCSGEDMPAVDCGVVLQSRCTGCHDVDRICRKLGRKSRQRWVDTIERMVKHGTELLYEEKITLVDCLDLREEGVLDVCRQ